MKKRLLIFLICILLCGCDRPGEPVPPSETVIPASPSFTPSITPRELTPSPTPITPLSRDGPWLVCEVPDPAKPSQFSILIKNIDGSGAHQLNLPPISEPIQLSPAGSPNGLHAAVRITNHELESVDHVLSTSIWILSLPDGKLIRKIALVGEQASIWLQQNPPSAYQGLSTTILGAPFGWSPDGRYLAFSGALDGESTDIYIYDLVHDEITQLTDGSKQAVIHSWSPDSQWIIHEASMFYLPQARVIYSSWAASVEGEVIRLAYGPFNNHPIIGWLSEETFLTYTKRERGSSKELRMVNLENGSTEFIYNQPFFEAAFDPVSSTIMLNLQPVDFASANSLAGIYFLAFETDEVKMILPGIFSDLNWQSPSELFSAVEGEKELVLFDADGEIFSALSYAEDGQINYSPDQRWMVISDDQHSNIYTPWGDLILAIDQTGAAIWLPDSSGFIFYLKQSSSSSTIYQYSLEDNWESQIIQENLASSECPVLIAP